jgi:phospholipid N-methyltransferase
MGKLSFLLEGIRNFKEVGTITRSSPAMCKKIASLIDSENDKIVIEIGAGDGVITKHLLKKLPKDGKLITFEINENLCDLIREIQDDRLVVINKGAEHMQESLSEMSINNVDAVVSAIPFLVLPKKLASEILKQCYSVLKANGNYMQVHYAKKLRFFYQKVFGNITIHFIPVNLPPAYVFHCVKSI